MSLEALTWAVVEGAERRLEPTKRLILMVMANRADESGYLYPSMAWLELRTGLDRRTIQRHIADMVAEDLMSRVPAKAETGAQTSNDWQLAMPLTGALFEDRGGRHSAGGGAAQRRPIRKIIQKSY